MGWYWCHTWMMLSRVLSAIIMFTCSAIAPLFIHRRRDTGPEASHSCSVSTLLSPPPQRSTPLTTHCNSSQPHTISTQPAYPSGAVSHIGWYKGIYSLSTTPQKQKHQTLKPTPIHHSSPTPAGAPHPTHDPPPSTLHYLLLTQRSPEAALITHHIWYIIHLLIHPETQAHMLHMHAVSAPPPFPSPAHHRMITPILPTTSGTASS